MYAGEPGPSFSQNNAKSCIQALLRNREQYPVISHSSFNFPDSCLAGTSESSETGISQQDPQSLNKLPVSEDQNSYDLNSPENLDNQNDFNYSQKLFHIADGNLYSIFSPIQGRSYGMKPSFLSKQKYTVQECHGRGRKNLRKGLKFHNFLPSESVTSEKDNGYLRTKWKVHSECRLREEHGTKQITISNWSQNVQNSPKSPVNFAKPAVKCDSSPAKIKTDRSSRLSNVSKFKDNQRIHGETHDIGVDPYDFSLSLQNNNPYDSANVFCKNSKESTATISKIRDSVRSTASKKDSLSFVLNSLLDRPVTCESSNVNCDAMEISRSYQSQKHRRKPMQTRRVVPYVKYLSIMEENDSVPLDLSSKDLEKRCESESPIGQPNAMESSCYTSDMSSIGCNNALMNGNAMVINGNEIQRINTPESVQNSNSNVTASKSTNIFPNSEHLTSLLQNQLSTSLMFLTPQFNGLKVQPNTPDVPQQMSQDMGNFNGNVGMVVNNKPIKMKHLFPATSTNISHPLMNPAQYSPHKSLIKESQSRTRKRNQRSVIKQKLEDTFRQNGFLVKTKQVSDGEATFCKFRQLRKYTRYYFKSWQQHLPDEVHKMWKGFLPPKTVLPPVSGINEPTNGNAPWEST